MFFGIVVQISSKISDYKCNVKATADSSERQTANKFAERTNGLGIRFRFKIID